MRFSSLLIVAMIAVCFCLSVEAAEDGLLVEPLVHTETVPGESPVVEPLDRRHAPVKSFAGSNISTQTSGTNNASMTNSYELEKADPTYDDSAGLLGDWTKNSYALSCADYGADTCHYGPYTARRVLIQASDSGRRGSYVIDPSGAIIFF